MREGVGAGLKATGFRRAGDGGKESRSLNVGPKANATAKAGRLVHLQAAHIFL